MELVEHGRQAAAQRQELRARAVEAHAHGALQRHAAAVTQQRAENDKRFVGHDLMRTENGFFLRGGCSRYGLNPVGTGVAKKITLLG